MKPSRWNPHVRPLAIYLFVFAVHAILHRYLATHDIVSAAFAAGPHTSLGSLVWIATFVGARLFVFLALPALVAWHATRWLAERTSPTR
jgi:hypothetical protein